MKSGKSRKRKLEKQSPKQAREKAPDSKRRTMIELALLGIIVAYALIYSIAYVGGPSFYGDDTAYLGLAGFVIQGIFHESPYIFSIRLLQFMPIAFFYEVFGVSMLSSSAWDIISFIGSIILAFYIGKILYDGKAGLIAALSLAFIPNVAMLASTISDDITSMFFVGLVIALVLYGSKKNSKLYFFLAGAFLVASVLVTPEAFLINLAVILFVIVEILRKRIKVNTAFLFAILGIIVAGIILMAYNYINSGNALITLSVSGHFYSKVGSSDTIPSTNIDPRFYLNTMFPYSIFNAIKSGNFSFNYIVNSYSGFFFYAIFMLLFLLPIIEIKSRKMKLIYIVVVLAVAIYYLNYLVPIQNSFACTSSSISPSCPMSLFYLTSIPIIILLVELAVLRKNPIYAPLFIFIFGLVLLTYGPMHVSLQPFNYLIVYRLERFLAVMGIPIVLIIGIGLAELIDLTNSKKAKIPIIAVIAIVMLFLIYTSLRINMFAYNTLAYERYDQFAIANYLMQYPSNTKIYFASGFSNVPIYMKFENLSRFMAYDSIENCTSIPNGTFIIIPKYMQMFNLDYTPHPRQYCPYWQLVLNPKYPYYYNSSIAGEAMPFGAKLYYVPGGSLKLINTTTSTTTNSTSPTTTVPTTTTTTIEYNTKFNYFNLTGVGYIAQNGVLENFTVVNDVQNVSVIMNKSSAYPGEYVNLSVVFSGNFKWYANPATSYYLNQSIHMPLINFHYYGVELSNESNMLLVQNNGPWYDYVTQMGEPHQLLYINGTRYLLVRWIITPTPSMSGKSLKLCGGYFATYENTTLKGGFGNLYNILAYDQTNVVNSSVINLQSKCAILNVT
ncbi:MAG: ArnT family glycosyltransferase [Candidatus Micrarchaeia archaeon]